MGNKIFYSALISTGIVIAVLLLGYIVVPCFSLNRLLTADSARYVFSSVSQSMAAIFALTFVIAGWITSYTARDLAKYVFRYVSSLYLTLITIFLFVLSIVVNFIYLGLTDDLKIGITGIGHYSYGLFASIFLFIGSISLLIFYAVKTYRVSVSPFKYFYEVVYNSIIPSLKSLRRFSDLQLPLEDYINNKNLEYSIKELFEDRLYIDYEGGDGYLYAYKAEKIKRALELINRESSNKRKIYYLVGIGEKIQKGRSIFAIENNDIIEERKIIKLLGKAAVVRKSKPGVVREFQYINPLFHIVYEQLSNAVDLKNYIYNLQELGEYYISNGSDLIKSVGNSWKGFYDFTFLSYWLEEFYKLIKEACIATGQMSKDGEILEKEDEPDFYVSAGLHRFISFLFSENQEFYFKKALTILYKYSKFKADIESGSIAREYINQLKYVVRNVSHITRRELKRSISLDKLTAYINLLLIEYMQILKEELLIQNNTGIVGIVYNMLNKYFVDSISYEFKKLRKEMPAEAFDKIKLKLMSMLFALTVYTFGKAYGENYGKEIFNPMYYLFRAKYINIRVISEKYGPTYVNPRLMLKNTNRILDELRWFVNVIDEDDMYDDTKPTPDSLVRTDEYCYFVYFIMLISKSFVISDKSFWYPDNVVSAKHYFEIFKEEAIKRNSRLQRIIFEIFGDDLDNLKGILDELDKLFEDPDA